MCSRRLARDTLHGRFGQAYPISNTAAMESLDFAAIWLRANCSCRECRDPGTQQELFDITSVPANIEVADSISDSESVEIVFTSDGHRSIFTWAWLSAHALDG